MKNNKRTNSVQAVMNEYVNWGGPIITRAEAYRDGQLRGYSAKMLDYTVFARQSVDAPEDPETHLAFHRRIQEMDGIWA